MEAKKVDLLGFQKNLNKQFIDIFESKKQGKIESVTNSELGLQTSAVNFNFFLSLKDLQNISMNNNYEESKLLASWICGFNQIRGEVFTILDFNKTIEYLLNKKDDKKYRKLSIDNRIVYFKEYSDEKIGLILDSVSLAYTPEFTPLFKQIEKDNYKTWELNEDLNFESFVKEDNMFKLEYEILKNLLNKKITIEHSDESLNEMFYYLISDVYLDINGKRPIFIINTKNLTKVLINISPLQ
jgi:hypothetical protein